MPSFVVWLILGGFAIVGGVVGGLLAGTSNVGFTDDAAVLGFVGLLAIAVERVLEFFWTVMGSIKKFGQWWPMKQIGDAFNQFETQTNELLNGVLNEVTKALTSAKEENAAAGQNVAALSGAIAEVTRQRERLLAEFDNAKTLAPGSSRLSLVGDVAKQTSEMLRKASDLASGGTSSATTSLEKATQVADRALQIVNSAKDNPARRIASILLGAGLGMAAAGFMGVNMFAAVLKDEAGLVAGLAGVLLTGLVIGLGSNPTHEVVKSLQRYKESKNLGDLVGTPEAPVPAADATIDSLAKISAALDRVAAERGRLLVGLDAVKVAASDSSSMAEDLGRLESTVRESIRSGTPGEQLSAAIEEVDRKRAAGGNGTGSRSNPMALEVAVDDLHSKVDHDIDRALTGANRELTDAGARLVRPANGGPASHRRGYMIRSTG